MAQKRGSQRGVIGVASSLLLFVLGALLILSGCSAEAQAPEGELDSIAQGVCIKGKPCCGTTACTDFGPCVTVGCTGLNTCTYTDAAELSGCKSPTAEGVCVTKPRSAHPICCTGCRTKGLLKGEYDCVDAPDEGACGTGGDQCKSCPGDACNTPVCDAGSCGTKPLDDKEKCLDGSGGLCWRGSCCTGCLDEKQNCQPSSLTTCGLTNSDVGLVDCTDCTDDNACTDEACVNGACDYPAVGVPTSCTDGDVCNGTESCSGTKCKSGVPLDCADKLCAVGKCDATDGCVYEAMTGEDCNDGDPCTTDDKCGAVGECLAGPEIPCEDGESCTTDSCSGGKCIHDPVDLGTDCNDKDTCTTPDKCTVDGKCKGVSPNGADCADTNPCTVDSQVSCTSTACNHLPALVTAACILDKCHAAGHCSGTDTTCVPGDEIDCDDANPCTIDSCNATTGCKHTNDASADCSDGDPCTENDVCVAGNCGGKPKKCLPLDACHEAGTCDPVSGTCDDPRAADEKPCPGGACDAGKCILDPNAAVGGEGAGGASGGDVTPEGGQAALSGGAGPTGPVVGEGGRAEAPSEAGSPTDVSEEPVRPFVRSPGGCSCQLPSGEGQGQAVWLVALAFLAGASRRRAGRGRLAP